MLAALLSLAAILALAGLNWWLGRSVPLIRDRGAAATRISLDLLDFDEQEGAAANAGDAYVALGGQSTDLAVAVTMGDGWVTRRLGPGSLRRVHRDGARLEIRTRDFTLPATVLTFDSAERAACWESRFAALAAVGSSRAGAAAPASTAHVATAPAAIAPAASGATPATERIA